MKKCWICLIFALFLMGCSAETFETVGDEVLQPVMATAGELSMTLPDSATTQAMQSEDGGKLYFCDGYVLTVQTLDGGDMELTAKSLCGFGTDSLRVMETAIDGYKRRDWVWTAAGEGSDQVGRAAVLDDGNYHYCVTVMADAAAAGKLETEWNALFASLSLTQYSAAT